MIIVYEIDNNNNCDFMARVCARKYRYNDIDYLKQRMEESLSLRINTNIVLIVHTSIVNIVRTSCSKADRKIACRGSIRGPTTINPMTVSGNSWGLAGSSVNP